MIVGTASGTRYEFDGGKVRRLGGEGLRRDGDWLKYTAFTQPEIGYSMVLILEPLGEGTCTVRTTNVVVSIDD